MKRDDDRPMIGDGSMMLGVRSPDASPHPDIRPDAAGIVRPGIGGMSVSPSLRSLPARLVPSRLRHLVPGAAGSNALTVWSLGEGPFGPGPVAESLVLRPDPKNLHHGFVEPDSVMSLDRYRRAIAATRDLWVKDEVGP